MQIVAYFYVDVENVVKIEQSAAELLRVFDFQNGGRPPSWIIMFFAIFLKKSKIFYKVAKIFYAGLELLYYVYQTAASEFPSFC